MYVLAASQSSRGAITSGIEYQISLNRTVADYGPLGPLVGGTEERAGVIVLTLVSRQSRIRLR